VGNAVSEQHGPQADHERSGRAQEWKKKAMTRHTARGRRIYTSKAKTLDTTEGTEITEARTRRQQEMEVIDLDEVNRISGCPVGVLINFNVRQLSQVIKRFRIRVGLALSPPWSLGGNPSGVALWLNVFMCVWVLDSYFWCGRLLSPVSGRNKKELRHHHDTEGR
jgi:hypothetical protein